MLASHGCVNQIKMNKSVSFNVSAFVRDNKCIYKFEGFMALKFVNASFMVLFKVKCKKKKSQSLKFFFRPYRQKMN